MSPRIDWPELFFSPNGRAGRTPFLIAAVVLIVGLVVYQSVVSGSALHWVTGIVVYPLLVYCGACVLAKRLHDRGRAGWWAAVVLVAMIMVWPHPREPWDLIGLAIIVWGVVELALMPGEQGTNRFGPNPHRVGAAAA